jgi:uncharacterized protein
MLELLLPLFGFLIVAFASMTGVGGGLFFVPLLTLAYGLAPAHAIGTSLLVIIFGGLSATISYSKQKRVFFKLGLLLAIATVPGSVVGAFLTSVLSGAILGLIFGVFLIIVAIRMITVTKIWNRNKVKKNQPQPDKTEQDLFQDRKRLAFGVSLGFFGGLVSGLLGVGGGVLLVPIMSLVLLIPIHAVVATSMFTMIFTSLAGTVQHWSLGNINFEYGLLLVIGALVGAQVGAWLCKKTSSEFLRIAFSIAMILVSIQMIMKFI